MLFALRDDDTSFFTNIEELESVYAKIFLQGIPVSLSIIPFDVPSFFRGIPSKFYQDGDPVSISNNKNLVDYINKGIKNRLIDINLHGFNHRYKVVRPGNYNSKYWLPEFFQIQDPLDKLKVGKATLENIFEIPILGFVPPSNSLSHNSLRAVQQIGLNVLGVPPIRILTLAHPFDLINTLWIRKCPRYPFNVQRYIKHKQIACWALTPTCDWSLLKNMMEECYRKDGIFVLATHYWELQQTHITMKKTLLDLLQELIQYADDLKASFVRTRDIWTAN